MSNFIEQARRFLPDLSRLVPPFLRSVQPEVVQTALTRYTYSQITKICDQALSPNRGGVLEARHRDRNIDSIYQSLVTDDSPAPITAAVVIGLARMANLSTEDVSRLRGIVSVLPIIDQQYRPFCLAIERSIQATTLRVNRPDYASSQNLAVVAADSDSALYTHTWGRTKFKPYRTLEGRVISSRKKFVNLLRGGEVDRASAGVRISVDLGVLTTQPEKLTTEEMEWLRANVHYIRLGGNPRLNQMLENYKNLLSIE